MNFLRIIAVVLLFIDGRNSARILVCVFSPSFSHQMVLRPLWRTLASRGHHLTLLTTVPMSDLTLENVREVDLSGAHAVMAAAAPHAPTLFAQLGQLQALNAVADWQLAQPEVRTIIGNESERFDLLITEVMSPVHLAFAERFNIPFIGVTPMDAPYRIHALMGNYLHPIAYPDHYLPIATPLDFKGRLTSTLFNWLNWFLQYYWVYRCQTQIVRKHFGKQFKDLSEIEKDMSLLLVNVNPIFHDVRPTGLNTVYMGGSIHIDVNNKFLPRELQEFLDSSEIEVIYFSLGTNIKSSMLSEENRKVIISTFEKLPYRVLWKVEENNLDNLPDNVKITTWVPQQKLLAHPKVVLFITHCGIQSVEEAIFFQVPMVGMPFMWDQPSNAKILERKMLGKTVDFQNFTRDNFEQVILDVINNPIYKSNIVELEKLSKDVEKSGLDRAVWWIEYFIRNKGAKHLKSPVSKLPVYQFYLLDVIGFLILIFTLSIFLIKLLLIFIFGRTRKQKSKDD